MARDRRTERGGEGGGREGGDQQAGDANFAGNESERLKESEEASQPPQMDLSKG